VNDGELRKNAGEVAARLGEGRRRILFITGAGLSAESGLPTYRGIGGLYENGGTEDDMPIEVALSGSVFRRAPTVTWKHLARLEQAVRGALPNRGHDIIAELDRYHDVVVLTQNVDGFHRTAGSRRVIDIHGDCHELLCTRCDHRERRENYAGLALPPECPSCGAVVRPDVVLFGEMLPSHKVDELLRELTRGFDAYFSVGTTSVFPYIAEPMHHAAQLGRLTVEINPGRTEVSGVVDVRFDCGAVRALTAIFDAG
jgi:NAD-dependent deacetylase